MKEEPTAHPILVIFHLSAGKVTRRREETAKMKLSHALLFGAALPLPLEPDTTHRARASQQGRRQHHHREALLLESTEREGILLARRDQTLGSLWFVSTFPPPAHPSARRVFCKQPKGDHYQEANLFLFRR